MRANVSRTANNEENKKLTPKQEQLIMLLVAGVPIVTAAQNTGIAEATAHRWLKLESFQAAYQAAQENVFDETLASIKLEAGEAVKALKRNMTGELIPPAVQVRSAQIVLEMCLNIYKSQEFEEKLVLLEQLLKAQAIGK